jgi:formate dehydrogenase major subunit
LPLSFPTGAPVSEYNALLQRYGVAPPAHPHHCAPHTGHPYLRFDPARCITCRRCLNVCEQVQGQFVYGVAGRGSHTHLLIGADNTFTGGACVSCGACVPVCPTGALTDADRADAVSAGQTTPSVCGYCGVGCRIEVETAHGRVARIQGAAAAAVNHGHLCAKGRYAHAWQQAGDRLTEPLLRVGGELQPVTWDRALAFIAGRLRAVRDQHGPDALGAFASSRSTNEACYLLQKLFRTVIGTNNVDCCARVCHSSTALALQLVTGTGAASASYADIERAKCIVLAGANPTEAHPIVGARLKQAVLHGAKLIVVDPRRTELAEYADVHLPLTPGTNVALFNALAKVLIEEGLLDEPYLRERVEGLEELRGFLGSHALADASRITGVSGELIRQAARLLGRSGPALFVHGLGLSELTQGTASVLTLCNLAMLTGSIGRPGAGMLPLRGQNNVQGAADMGCTPNLFTGYQPLNDAGVRARIQGLWGALPPEQPGLPTTEMLNAATRGEVRALWVMGEDMLQSDPCEAHVREALGKLDLLILQDLFLPESAPYAHVILPAAGTLENDGTYTNGERRIQRVRPALPPPGEARPDWLIVRDAARALGADWNYDSPAQVMDEIALVAPRLFGGVNHARLEPDGLQWPCPSVNHPGTATLHADRFLRGKGCLTAIEYEPSPEHGVEGFPYLLVTGRVLHHYNVGTMTRRTPQRELAGRDELEMHPEDARREGLRDGALAVVESRWGRVTVPVHVSARPVPGTLFLSFHFPETHANRLTGPHLDPQSKCPQYKATAVRVSGI